MTDKKKQKTLFIALLLPLMMLMPVPATAEKLILMLDGPPNVDHLPIFLARESGYFDDHHVEVDIITPSAPGDALDLVASGEVDIAVSYQPRAIIAADKGLDIKAVTPLVTHPLTTLLYLDEDIKTPADLSGKTIGYTMPGVTDMMLKVFADINGITDYTPVNLGVASLVSKEVDAVMVPCKTYDTMGMKSQGYEAKLFELEKYGIPDYEELIIVAGSKTLDEKAEAVRGFVKAVRIALAEVQIDPEIAMGLYLEAVPEADEALETRAYELTRPYFAGPEGHDPVKWQAFADFALACGLIQNRVDTTDLIHTWE